MEMLPLLRNLFRRPAIRMGRVVGSQRRDGSPLRNAQFVSFIAQSGSLASFSSDRYEGRMRWQKRFKTLLMLGTVGGLAWLIVESAKALTMF